MICPECKKNWKKSQGFKCGCGYRFILDPSACEGMTDNAFLMLINATSAADTLYFTENQLHTQFCRRRERKRRTGLIVFGIVALIACGIGFLLVTSSARKHGLPLSLAPVTTLTVLAACVLGTVFAWTRPHSRSGLDLALKRWRSAKRPIEKLIEAPRLGAPPPEWQEQDIYDYGFERLLIVQRDILVDLFVLNDFHAQQRTLVVSMSGYPDYLTPLARKALEANPSLPVAVLHDATTKGRLMSKRVSESDLAPLEGRQILDLGLFPEDVKAIGKLRPLHLGRNGYQTPVDALPYMLLSAMTADALLGSVVFHQLLAQGHTGDVSDGSGGYG